MSSKQEWTEHPTVGNRCPVVREYHNLRKTEFRHVPAEMTPAPLPIADALGNVIIEGIPCSRMGFSICKHCGSVYLDRIMASDNGGD